MVSWVVVLAVKSDNLPFLELTWWKERPAPLQRLFLDVCQDTHTKTDKSNKTVINSILKCACQDYAKLRVQSNLYQLMKSVGTCLESQDLVAERSTL